MRGTEWTQLLGLSLLPPRVHVSRKLELKAELELEASTLLSDMSMLMARPNAYPRGNF